MGDTIERYVCLECRSLPFKQPRPSLDRRYAKGRCPTCKNAKATFVLVDVEKPDGK